jgi:hypothetical protein
VGGVGVAGLESMQAGREEESVFGKAVVEVVVDQLAQLGGDAGRRRHGGRGGAGAGVRMRRRRLRGKSTGRMAALGRRRHGSGTSRGEGRLWWRWACVVCCWCRAGVLVGSC